ncbi:hypothetical protein [Bacillus haynesii]|uniref:hypothetical protein n=1 Tax=Bacillus haynesii TaxID=1925021 RepID=UPI001F60C6D3|nr:hypothetical protein [Bacillus haynesii]MCI4125926.1 hypothetical protein [Bacillus haynesii]
MLQQLFSHLHDKPAISLKTILYQKSLSYFAFLLDGIKQMNYIMFLKECKEHFIIFPVRASMSLWIVAKKKTNTKVKQAVRPNWTRR